MIDITQVGYTAEAIAIPWFQRSEHPQEISVKDWTMYGLNIKVHPSGHACTALGRVDLGNRRSITEQLGCYEGVPATRTAMLQLALSAALEALRDAREGVV